MPYKCYGCQEMLPEEAFHKDVSRRGPRKVAGKCKQCKSGYLKDYNAQHVERRRDYQAARYVEHGEHIRYQNKQWRDKNKDKMLGYWHNYKAKLRANGPIDKDVTRLKVYERDQGTCKLCNQPCKYEESSIDHIRPVSKGGTHTWGNVQNAHKVCNIRKSNKFQEMEYAAVQ